MRSAVDLEGVHEAVLDGESRPILEMASEGVFPSGDDEVPRETAPPFRAERAGLGDLATIPISISREDFAHVEFEHLVRQGPAANDRNPVADAQGCTPYRDNSTTPACDERVVGGRNDFAPGSSPEPQQRGAESVPADRADLPPDDPAFFRKAWNFQVGPRGQVAPFRRPFVADSSVRHEPIHEFGNREDRERCLRLRFGGLRRGLPPARGRLRLLLLRSRLHLRGGRAEFLEDLLRFFLREELRESLDLRGRQFFEGETRVGEDDSGLLREAAVAQCLDRRGSGHPHSSDGGSSSSTSTSSSEISTYMSFSVRPYDAISCSRRRSFQDGSSPRTS